jgi:hypothetical protein
MPVEPTPTPPPKPPFRRLVVFVPLETASA